VVVVRAPKMRAYLDRRNTTFLTTLLQPDSGSVAFADIHEFLCRLPSDTCTPLFLDLVRHQKGFPAHLHVSIPDVQTSRQEADAVAILGTPLCPSGGRQSAWV
jgi:hypothetical protein